MGGRRGIEAEVKILTLKNGYHLWAQKLGQGQHKLLCLHGGPGSDHELFEEFGKNLAKYDTEVYMYDQLGSYYSEHPDFSIQENVDKYAKIEYFVDEVEEVRQLLGLEEGAVNSQIQRESGIEIKQKEKRSCYYHRIIKVEKDL